MNKTSKVKYYDLIVSCFVASAVVWLLFGLDMGVWAASELVWPSLDLGQRWFTFGRVRMVHTNAVVFGFAGSMLIGTSFYVVQRVCATPLFAPKLAWVVFIGWNAGLAVGMLSLFAGFNTGKEYAELEWPLDIAITLIWVLYAIVFFGTIVKRKEPQLYVGLWYYIAFVVVIAILHIVNSFELPVSLVKSYPIYNGAADAVVQWWYGHNAVGFFLTGGFLGMLLYFLPKITRIPLWSYRLSIISFWAFVFLYIWAGPHHLHFTSVPDWVQGLGVIMSLLLLFPSWGSMINGFMSVNGAWHRVMKEIPLKFIVFSLIFYGLATFEGPLLAIQSVNVISHYTEWTVSHVHSGALGWNAFVSFGVLYYLVPKLAKSELYSPKLAFWHFNLAIIGVVLYMVALWIAGVLQGIHSIELDEAGVAKYSFMEIVSEVMPYYVVRLIGGTLFYIGALLMAFNFYMTYQKRNLHNQDGSKDND